MAACLRLLRTRRERPRCCGAAEQSDERTSFHSITSLTQAIGAGGIDWPIMQAPEV
jgi:hypothetical protein